MRARECHDDVRMSTSSENQIANQNLMSAPRKGATRVCAVFVRVGKGILLRWLRMARRRHGGQKRRGVAAWRGARNRTSDVRGKTDVRTAMCSSSRRRGSRSLTATTEHGPWGGTNTGHPTMILTGMTHAHYQPALHPPTSDLGEYRAPVPTYHPPPPKSPP